MRSFGMLPIITAKIEPFLAVSRGNKCHIRWYGLQAVGKCAIYGAETFKRGVNAPSTDGLKAIPPFMSHRLTTFPFIYSKSIVYLPSVLPN